MEEFCFKAWKEVIFDSGAILYFLAKGNINKLMPASESGRNESYAMVDVSNVWYRSNARASKYFLPIFR